MTLPHAPRNLQQERAGILAVATELNRFGLIWRETPMADVGIDGQIEWVDESGQATGRLIAAQIKSGDSYFRDGGAEWRFYPNPKHRFYWERFPVPVLLFLHSPTRRATYWTDARQALRNPDTSSGAYIGVPKRNRLQEAGAEELFSTLGGSGRPFMSPEEVLAGMVTSVSPGKAFPLSYFDLFATGLTNTRRSIYYGMDLTMQIAEALLEGSGKGWSPGAQEHDFLFGFVQFLVEQHLAHVDISDCLIDWYDRLMQPRFIAPLTSRGRALVRLIDERQDAFVAQGRLQLPPGVGVAREELLHVQLSPSHCERIPIIKAFQRLIAEETPATEQ